MSVPVRVIGRHARTNSVMGLSEDGLKFGQAVEEACEGEEMEQRRLGGAQGLPFRC